MEASKFDQDPLPEMVEVHIAKGPALDQLDPVVDPLDDAVAVAPLEIVQDIGKKLTWKS